MKKLSAVFSILFLLCVVFYSPKEVFAIVGDVQLDVSTGGQIIGSALMTNKFTDAANTDYYLDPAAATTSLTVAGNVGIGTTAPSGLLHLSKSVNGGDVGLTIQNTFVGTSSVDETTGVWFKHGTYNAGGMSSIKLGDFISNGGEIKNALGFYVVGDGATNYEKMRIDNAGNVGIGTTGPGYRLDTRYEDSATNTVSDVVNIVHTTTGTQAAGFGGAIVFSNERSYDGSVVSSAKIAGVTEGTDGPGGLAFWTRFDTGNPGWSERVRIDKNGNVGIGTTAPGAKLEVSGGDSYLQTTSIGQSGGHYQEIGYNVGFTGTIDTYTYRVTDTAASMRMGYDGFEFRTAGSGTAGSALTLSEKVRITSAGNVGIGTAAPGYKLTIAGPTNDWGTSVNYNVDGAQYGLLAKGSVYSGYFVGPGYLSAAAWSYGSDKRLKENIQYYSDKNIDALNIIGQLKPASFDYIDHNNGINEDGFIAQDVQSILPNLVSTDKDGMLSLKTTNLIPYLVKGMQEQQKQIEKLQKEIEELKKK